ncbi:MAG TPA: MMPL family transporter [Gaiellaceae bacterium]|nr:MMPL family transporter [Gaiellaceae bacterium]
MLAQAFATIVVRLRWLVVAVWLVAAAAATLWLPSLQQAESASLADLVPEDAEAVRAAERSTELFSVPLTAQTAVVQRDPDGLGEEAQTRVAERAVTASEERGDGISFALPLVNTARLVPGSREDSTTAITFLFFEPGTSIGEETRIARDWAARDAGRPEDALVGVTGSVPARLAQWQEIEGALPWVTVATILLVFAILALNYRALGAPLVALLGAGVAYLVAVRVAAWVGERWGVAVPSDVEPIMVVLLLGIVTDYSVFFLSGMRRRLAQGDDPVEAAVGATSQFLPIVATAGLIVACGAAALLAGKLEFFRAFGPGMALTVVVSLAVSLTLVPALMAIGGRATFRPSLSPTPPPEEPAARRRGRRVETWSESLAQFATSKPVAVVVLLGTLVLAAVASRGLAETELGFTAIRGLPAESEERRAAVAAEEGFAPGILAPTVLLVEQASGPLDEESFAGLQERLASEEGIAAVVGPADEAAREVEGLVDSDAAPAGRFLLVLEDEPHGGPAIETLDRLREEIDSLVADSGFEEASAALTGETALAAETVDTLTGDLVRIAIAAFAVNLILLMIFLRAVVAPLYLLFASALAFAATLGLTTFVFQTLLGHDEITYYVPFAVAVLLLSLGSDYNVFLVGRIWQEAERSSVRDAVATAAPRASRTIAIAGLALAFSFATLAFIPLLEFREFAFAMTVGVLLDAFLVRALVVPALVSLFGELSWWPARRRLALRPTEGAPPA